MSDEREKIRHVRIISRWETLFKLPEPHPSSALRFKEMGRLPAQPVTFYVPDVVITISVEDVNRLVAELRRYSREGLREPRLGVADRLEQAVARNPGTHPVTVPDLPEDEQQALLRAVEHLRLGSGGMSKELGRLHFSLKGWVPMPRITYEVSFGYGGGTATFTSYTGSYEVGDRLPVTTPDECWEVAAVDPPREGSEAQRLMVERCQALTRTV